MKLRIWVVVLSFLTVMNLAAVAAFLLARSDTRDDRGFRGPGLRPQFMERGPHGLESEGREQFMTLIHDFRTETRDLRDRAVELEQEIMEQMQRERVDRAAVDSLLREVSAVRLEISERATDKMIDAKEFLTPRQQKMFYRAILDGRPGEGPPGKRARPRR
jgi:Spy/CpxP family protein refolding chaperone